MTAVYELDPLTDSRWPEFVSHHPDASVFHTREWLSALSQSYGYRPIVYTTSRGKELRNGIAFCSIQSWLTGRRLVSLPFSDHCQPLADNIALEAVLDYLQMLRKRDHLRYVELRPQFTACGLDENRHFEKTEEFNFQQIDLRPESEKIFRGFHDSCIRRKIKRAERENLRYDSGRSDTLVAKFRTLLRLTRRRHNLPPQPASWFHNLVRNLGKHITFHLLSKDETPVASIVTLHFGRMLVYKYGCSDTTFNNLGGTPLLFWKAIQQAKDEGNTAFDLGRSDYRDSGLIAFKEHLGATSSELRYYRNPFLAPNSDSQNRQGFAKQILSRLPDPLFDGAGALLYRHMG